MVFSYLLGGSFFIWQTTHCESYEGDPPLHENKGVEAISELYSNRWYEPEQ